MADIECLKRSVLKNPGEGGEACKNGLLRDMNPYDEINESDKHDDWDLEWDLYDYFFGS